MTGRLPPGWPSAKKVRTNFIYKHDSEKLTRWLSVLRHLLPFQHGPGLFKRIRHISRVSVPHDTIKETLQLGNTMMSIQALLFVEFKHADMNFFNICVRIGFGKHVFTSNVKKNVDYIVKTYLISFTLIFSETSFSVFLRDKNVWKFNSESWRIWMVQETTKRRWTCQTIRF